MMQQPKPEDYVIATGEAHSVQEFVELAFNHAGLDWERHVEIDPRYFRPTEVDLLMGMPPRRRPSSNGREKSSLENWFGSWLTRI